MAYNIKERVHVDIRVHGEDFSGSYGPGEVEVPKAVGDHLVALGLATEVNAAQPAKKNAKIQEVTSEEEAE